MDGVARLKEDFLFNKQVFEKMFIFQKALSFAAQNNI